jgi:hypothetical protein
MPGGQFGLEGEDDDLAGLDALRCGEKIEKDFPYKYFVNHRHVKFEK